MSEKELIQTLVRVQGYLEKANPIPCTFASDIRKILSCIDHFIDYHYPLHVVIKEVTPSWLFVFVATYLFGGKRISVDLVAYLDGDVVRFLRTPSCLKFNDTLPEMKGFSEEEKVSNYLAERYALPFSGLLHPSQRRYHSQRLLSLINRIIDELHEHQLSSAFKELLHFLEEVLSRSPLTGSLPSGDITFSLDELLLLLDDFLTQLTCGKSMCKENLLRWKRTLSLKIRTLIIFLQPQESSLRLHYQRKMVYITLLSILPYMEESSYLQTSFHNMKQHIILAQPITLDFLESLLEDIETFILLGKTEYYFSRIKRWEKAFSSFFAYHRDKCFSLAPEICNNASLVCNNSPSASSLSPTKSCGGISTPTERCVSTPTSPSFVTSTISLSPSSTSFVTSQTLTPVTSSTNATLTHTSSRDSVCPIPDFTSTSQTLSSQDAGLTTSSWR